MCAMKNLLVFLTILKFTYGSYEYQYADTTEAYGNPKCFKIEICEGDDGFIPGADKECQVHADCMELSSISPSIPSNVSVLAISGSVFKTLASNDLQNMTKLRELKLEYNDINTIEARSFSAQSKLKTLKIVGNMFTEIVSDSFIGLTSAKELFLENNGIKHIHRGSFTGLPSLTVLDLSINSIQELEDGVFSGAENLIELILHNNNISFISQNAFVGLSKLEILNLKVNSISEFPSAQLKPTVGLITLLLGKNPIREIRRDALRGMKSLRQLWLEGCEIRTIARRAFNNKNLNTLNLEFNFLQNFPNLGRMKSLEVLLLKRNPWKCDCDAVPMLRWLKAHNFTGIFAGCESPESRSGLNMLAFDEISICEVSMPDNKFLTHPRHPIIIDYKPNKSKNDSKPYTDVNKTFQDDYDLKPDCCGGSGGFSGDRIGSQFGVNRDGPMVQGTEENVSVIVVIVVVVVVALLVVVVLLVWKVASRHERNTRPRFRRQAPIVRPPNSANPQNGNGFRLQRHCNDIQEKADAQTELNMTSQTTLDDVTTDDITNGNKTEYCDVVGGSEKVES